MGKVVGIRFQRGCRIYDFDAGHFVLAPGDMVIVQTEQGLALGQVARGPRPLPAREEEEEAPAAGLEPGPEEEAPSALVVAAEPETAEEATPLPPPSSQAPPLRPVYRLATPEDLEQAQANARLEREAHVFCLERIAARALDMNLVKVDCLFDRAKIIFYFTAEGRLDFRELVRDLVSRLRTRVELRQIGVRHEAKLLGGLGSCGRELCCATFLKDFAPVSVKMAKEQNLSLNPTKISGLCGRLMCCLTYEYETYLGLKRDLPKLGKKVVLGPELEAKVVRQNVLERQVTLLLPDGREATVTPEELPKLAEELAAQAAQPRGRGQAPPRNEQPPAPAPDQPSGQPAGQGRGRGRRRGQQKGPSDS